ncbi:MAG: histidine triad nucleotide-binding protein [Fibrobacterota bacterium]
MSDCLFCRIVAGSVPCKKVLETDTLLAFHDITPQAPVHVLILPKKHIADTGALTENDRGLLGNLLLAAQRIANDLGLTQGHRLVLNCGKDGGQAVFHLHLHLLGGRPMTWPPG